MLLFAALVTPHTPALNTAAPGAGGGSSTANAPTPAQALLGIYAHVLRRREDAGAALDALIQASNWA
jgi:hypothetical protein